MNDPHTHTIFEYVFQTQSCWNTYSKTMIQKKRKTRLLKLDVLGWRFEHEALEFMISAYFRILQVYSNIWCYSVCYLSIMIKHRTIMWNIQDGSSQKRWQLITGTVLVYRNLLSFFVGCYSWRFNPPRYGKTSPRMCGLIILGLINHQQSLINAFEAFVFVHLRAYGYKQMQ